MQLEWREWQVHGQSTRSPCGAPLRSRQNTDSDRSYCTAQPSSSFTFATGSSQFIRYSMQSSYSRFTAMCSGWTPVREEEGAAVRGGVCVCGGGGGGGGGARRSGSPR